MIKNQAAVLGVLLVVFLAPGAGGTAAQAQTESAKPSESMAGWKAFRMQERFAGSLQAKSPSGRTVSLNVGTRVWTIEASLGPQHLKVDQFTVFQLRGGKLTTEIKGEKKDRVADEFWAVPAGATMEIRLKGETALLEATSVAVK